MIASFGVDHEKILVVDPAGILNDPLQMFRTGRNRVHKRIKGSDLPAPVLKFPFTSTGKQTQVPKVAVNVSQRIDIFLLPFQY